MIGSKSRQNPHPRGYLKRKKKKKEAALCVVMSKNVDEDSPPEAVSPSSSDSSEESTSSESEQTDDEDLLCVNISAPTGCDPPPKQFFRFRGKFVAKEFTVHGLDHPSLFCGVIGKYDQTTKKHEVNYQDD